MFPSSGRISPISRRNQADLEPTKHLPPSRSFLTESITMKIATILVAFIFLGSGIGGGAPWITTCRGRGIRPDQY